MSKIMQRTFLTLGCVLALGGIAAAGTIRVENSDSKAHKVELKCSGSSSSFEVRASTTASYTFNSMAKECEITGGSIKFPTTKLVDGQAWKIKDGAAKAN